MATVVVSGRVEESTKSRVDAVLARAGKTSGEVIKDVWATIAQTGKLPITQEQEDEFKRKRERFAEFLKLVESAPPSPSWFIGLTDQEMRSMIVEDTLEKERRYVPAHD